mgnify:CR=1 FL=1
MPLITRPNSIWDAIKASGDAFQIQAAEEARQRELERQRQKRLTTTAIGAGVGAGVGLAAASLLGLGATAGAIPAGAGQAVGLGAAWVPGASASALGTATAGLTGAALGANIAQGAMSGDLAGPLGMAAGVANQAYQAQQDRAAFGYVPSHEERAALAHMAAKMGVPLGQLMQTARQGGPSVGSQLKILQHQAAIDEQITNAQGEAFKEYARFHQTVSNVSGANGIVQFEPDFKSIGDINQKANDAYESVQAFQSSGGQAGRPLYEHQQQFQELNQQLERAIRGNPRPKPPAIRVQSLTGPPKELPLDTWSEIEPGFWSLTGMNADGTKHTITSRKDPLLADPEYLRFPLGSPERADAEAAYVSKYVVTGKDGVKYRRLENGTLEPLKIESDGMSPKDATKLYLGEMNNVGNQDPLRGTTSALPVEELSQQAMQRLNEAVKQAPAIQAIMSGKIPPQTISQPQEGSPEHQKLLQEGASLQEKLQTGGYLSRKEIARLEEIIKQLEGP